MKTQINKQFEGAANIRRVKHKNNWWKIRTRKERSEYGLDYQDQDYQNGLASEGWALEGGEFSPD